MTKEYYLIRNFARVLRIAKCSISKLSLLRTIALNAAQLVAAIALLANNNNISLLMLIVQKLFLYFSNNANNIYFTYLFSENK